MNKAYSGNKVHRVNMGNNKFNKVNIEKEDRELEEKERGGVILDPERDSNNL